MLDVELPPKEGAAPEDVVVDAADPDEIVPRDVCNEVDSFVLTATVLCEIDDVLELEPFPSAVKEEAVDAELVNFGVEKLDELVT